MPVDALRGDARGVIAARRRQPARCVDTEALPGAGSAPGVTMPSVGIVLAGDLLAHAACHDPTGDRPDARRSDDRSTSGRSTPTTTQTLTARDRRRDVGADVDSVVGMSVVATAGHVDHGKSSLVLALTGTDPDRFEEEKRRGLTIDLGFAHTTLPSGAGVSFVDVPGHVRFLRNMLAGVGGVDACVFVVAATEGWKPQSEEHLRILELLGMRHGRDRAHQGRSRRRRVARDRHARSRRPRRAARSSADAPIVPVVVDRRAPASTSSERRSTLSWRRTPGVGRSRPAAAVDRPGVRRQGQRHRGHRHAHRRIAAPRRHRGDRARRSLGPHPIDPDAGAMPSTRSVPATGSRSTSTVSATTRSGRGDAVRRPRPLAPHRTASTPRSTCSPALDHDVSRRGAYLAYIGSRELPGQGARARRRGTRARHVGCVRLFLPDALAAAARRSVRAARVGPRRDGRRWRDARHRPVSAGVEGASRPLGRAGRSPSAAGSRWRSSSCSPARPSTRRRRLGDHPGTRCLRPPSGCATRSRRRVGPASTCRRSTSTNACVDRRSRRHRRRDRPRP